MPRRYVCRVVLKATLTSSSVRVCVCVCVCVCACVCVVQCATCVCTCTHIGRSSIVDQPADDALSVVDGGVEDRVGADPAAVEVTPS